MSLLDGLRVACFDLFDTLIRVRAEDLPWIEVDGRRIRSTIPILHEQLLEPRGVPLGALREAMRTAWTGIRAELDEDGEPGERCYPEISAVEKYRRVLTRLEALTPAEVPGLAEQIAVLHHRCLVAAAEPVEGATLLLETLRERGLATVLISNWDHARAARELLDATGLGPLLDHRVISESVGLRKPNPRLFELALEPFSVTPQAAMHVGDLALADAWGAARLGFRTVWIDRRGEGWPESLGEAPTLTISTLLELLDRVRGEDKSAAPPA